MFCDITRENAYFWAYFREELSRYKMHFTSFVHSIHDANERLREMEEESQVLGMNV